MKPDDKRNGIGIMQGRLLPPLNGRLQSFPAGNWNREFALAEQAELSCIEWIFEDLERGVNPILLPAGRRQITELTATTGVAVSSICADFFMTERLITDDAGIDKDNVAVLRNLIGIAAELEIKYIVLPFVDSSSLETSAQLRALGSLTPMLIPDCQRFDIEIHLETDLEATKLADLLSIVDSPWIKANFDTGNSAALGFDPIEELTVLNDRLGSVHIKDRMYNGPSVPLGTGNVDFPKCFQMFEKIGYHRPFILQAARGKTSSEVEWATANRAFVEHFQDGSSGVPK